MLRHSTLLVGAAMAVVAPASAQRLEINIPRVANPPRIDGDLSDTVWKETPSSDTFVRFGASTPVTERTEAWVATDGKSLFVAFYCHDSQPEKIRARETQRGGDTIKRDDSVRVVIDSQDTHRNVSTFFVNAGNTQREDLEGGTAGNWTWAGVWRSATRRVADGWTCEVAIPFSMLRHPAGAKGFGLALMRRIARETNPMVWPAIAEAGRNDKQLPLYLPEVVGVTLPRATPRPVVLPFTLGTVGDGAWGRVGLDVKYPFSTTLTGVLAVNPDFQTLENDVASISFSYNEQRVDDRRPFFAEGAGFLPESDLFYSRRIAAVDEGIKLVGRTGRQSIGFLATNRSGGAGKGANAALRLEQGVGKLSSYGLSFVDSNPVGATDNRVARLFGTWGREFGKRQLLVTGRAASSWLGGARQGDAADIVADFSGQQGETNYQVGYTALDKDFISNAGLLNDRDRRSWTFKVSQANQMDRGAIEVYDTGVTYRRADRQDGAFFFETFRAYLTVLGRRGIGISPGILRERRVQSAQTGRFNDQIDHFGLVWNAREVFRFGGVGYDSGRIQNQRYRLWEVEQSVLVQTRTSLKGTYAQQTLGDIKTRQTIVTGTWRVDPYRTVSARLVSQNGTGNIANVGAQRGTNLYFAFGQRVPSGTDVFVLLGDPNAAETRGLFTVKLVRPL